jgi:regulator of protease activity HflC (stomatin/prohibitin superfamily)
MLLGVYTTTGPIIRGGCGQEEREFAASGYADETETVSAYARLVTKPQQTVFDALQWNVEHRELRLRRSPVRQSEHRESFRNQQIQEVLRLATIRSADGHPEKNRHRQAG